MTDDTNIPGAPEWAQEFYRRVHSDVRPILVEFQRLRDRVESLERWRMSVERERDTEPPTAE